MIRLGFAGAGWIGLNRMQALLNSGFAEAVAIYDPASDAVQKALELAPRAEVCWSFQELLKMGVDGVVIATPNSLHAEQSLQALEMGLAVFCQKPLGRDAQEVRRIVEAARASDRLLGVDLSYRFTEASQCLRNFFNEGKIGSIYAIDLTFHNAYGPDKAWFYDRELSGGGCLMDLGVHLVDLLFWLTHATEISGISSRLFSRGKRLGKNEKQVEDYVAARFDLHGKDLTASVQLACSWKLQAGYDALISAVFYGTQGGLALRNERGSFYDFVAERFHGTGREVLCAPPDQWGGRAAVDWASRLQRSRGFDSSIESLVRVTEVLDQLYGAGDA
jgi:predicted dehydrogenase